MSNIKIVRLATGEELICEVTHLKHTPQTDGAAYILKDVAILIPTQQNSLGLAPFMAYSDASKGMEIDPKFVMFVVDPVQDLKNQYQQMFSKIMTPESSDKKLII